MRWLPRLPGLGEWRRVIDWRVIQLQRLRNVELITGASLDAAGGARVRRGDRGRRHRRALGGRRAQPARGHAAVPGADAALDHVLTPEQIMLEGKRPPGERVVVYDCEGYTSPPGSPSCWPARAIASSSSRAWRRWRRSCDLTLEGPLLRRRLHDAGVALRRDVTLTGIEPGRLAARGRVRRAARAGGRRRRARRPPALRRRALPRAARRPGALAAEGVEALYRIGDCVAPRLIAEAIFDGHRLAREIDSEDPSVPLPYRRERLVAGAVSPAAPTSPAGAAAR